MSALAFFTPIRRRSETLINESRERNSDEKMNLVYEERAGDVKNRGDLHARAL